MIYMNTQIKNIKLEINCPKWQFDSDNNVCV